MHAIDWGRGSNIGEEHMRLTAVIGWKEILSGHADIIFTYIVLIAQAYGGRHLAAAEGRGAQLHGSAVCSAAARARSRSRHALARPVPLPRSDFAIAPSRHFDYLRRKRGVKAFRR